MDGLCEFDAPEAAVGVGLHEAALGTETVEVNRVQFAAPAINGQEVYIRSQAGSGVAPLISAHAIWK